MHLLFITFYYSDHNFLMNISFCHKTVTHNLIQFGTIDNTAASQRKKDFSEESIMGKKITTSQVIEIVDNLTLHFLHKYTFLRSHLLVAKILKAKYKSKQQSAMEYSMDGKWQNTIFRKENNCQRQVAINTFS